MNDPLVSIIIPTFSRPEMFYEALSSATSQCYTNIEVVVSDDSSDGATRDMVALYRAANPSQRLIYRRNVPALGAARNFADSLGLASGKYVNLLMDDDRLRPDMIETMVRVMEEDASVVLCTSCRSAIDEHGVQRSLLPGLEMVVSCDAVLDGIGVGDLCLERSMNFIGEPSTALFRADAMSEPFGSMSDRLYGCNVDMATWLTLASSGRVSFTRRVLSETRVHSSRQSNTMQMRLRSLTDWLHQIRVGRDFGFLADRRADNSAVDFAIRNAEAGIVLAASLGKLSSELESLKSDLLREMSLLVSSRRPVRSFQS